jgi:hypothetical protein
MKILDWYLRHPLKCDLLLSAVIVFALHHFAAQVPLASFERGGILSSLAGTAVSLAGFILAALTIIATFRANVASKGVLESITKMESLLNSSAYGEIVEVFQGAIVGLIICTLVLYTGLIFGADLPPRWINLINIVALFEIIVSITRCLYILFRVITIDLKDRQHA